MPKLGKPISLVRDTEEEENSQNKYGHRQPEKRNLDFMSTDSKEAYLANTRMVSLIYGYNCVDQQFRPCPRY